MNLGQSDQADQSRQAAQSSQARAARSDLAQDADPVRPTHAVAVPVTALWEAPDRVRAVDAPMVADRPDAYAWARTLTHEQKLDLGDRVLTQLLCGEPVAVIEQAGDWVRVVAPWQPSELDPRGYPGWVPRSHLGSTPDADPGARRAVVAVTSTPLRPDPTDPASAEATAGSFAGAADLAYGTILPVLDDSRPESIQVALPGGREAWLDRSACVLRNSDPIIGGVPGGHPENEPDGDAVIAAARRFLGLQYLWGGTCAYGLDCSGLVHLTFRALGSIVPRDAHDQAAASRQLPRAQAGAGDLLFFARPGKSIHHVGFAVDGPDRVLHAPGTGNPVTDEPLSGDRASTVLGYVGRFTSRTP